MKRGILTIALAVLSLMGSRAQQAYELVSLTSTTVKANDGNTYRGEKGRIKVPENRENENSEWLELPFFRMKTEHERPLAPIFIFEGGPGDDPSALQRLSEFAPILKAFAERSDVVLVDQRGNGGAIPKLSCPNTLQFSLDTPLDLSTFRKVYRKYMEDCSGSWQKKGRDLSGYNVISMADDVEALRQAMSYGKVMLFGGSFGSHHALAYIKRYPENVDRILLDSPEGLPHTVKLPSSADEILEQLSGLVKTNAELSQEIPSFTDLVRDVLEGLEQHPIRVSTTHPITSKEVHIVLGKFDLQFITGIDLGRRAYRELPYRYLQMKKGDYSWLASRAIHLRLAHIESLMAALTDCASATASDRMLAVQTEAKEAILGNALNNVIFEVMDILPIKDISKELNQYFKSGIPIVLICGRQDARTPVSNAEEILEVFTNGRLVVVEHGSHDLFSEALDQLLPIMQGYLKAEHPLEFVVPERIVAPLNLRTR
ncbi:alpha/beta fold hydrolase [Muriicola sp. Z0-33]|uniref:alpha/beta fold hydrolase n=1 Tax=Muriicola sp. Z0-33 TaxID=2816957 RepID=UPI0022388611|nr:alpha/beta fold hydrolase [Muriicola sp. Z0-33]MCW5515293.1 alpha/beta fold hydrolase [Muriicola sp. Z0-33]